MSNPAGWFPQPDGQQRYWDGEQWTDHFAPVSAPAVTPIAKPARRWFKKKRFILPIAGLAFFVIAASLGSGGSTPSPVADSAAVQAAAVTPADVAPIAETPAPAPAPAASTCDNAREAILTGSPSSLSSAMNALVADKKANSTAREYAQNYLQRDKDNKDLQKMDVSLIQMACS